MAKKESQVCKTCIHYDEQHDCKKAGLDYGTDGYGPWRKKAVCVNDPLYENPKNLYEPAKVDDFAKLNHQVKSLQDKLNSANYKVENLSKELAHKIANS